MVLIVATYNDVVADTNHKVSSEVTSRGYTPEQLAQASGKIEQTFNSVESCGLRFTKPFQHLNYGLLGYILNLHESYERGVLPFPGSVSEQPAQIMEIFNVLKQLKIEHQIKTQKSGRK